ncbi:translocation/assembly module TamB domain-containing protein [Tranquillimonas alkanivorans]|uniref:Autotransporter secretion inner membrane protein TamB n=1 Tax=Tranquillimonas alkanivorans TaxID=441119 RepID=A0A1I5PCU5_9RHOB|nr:translocation/assembly module TamB domain-containing protein [Tranquillimonas alkanivorans]SFP31919.1 autotransporter secretion inner membrane protein TamB [Tranquillimonas alkanivorans]
MRRIATSIALATALVFPAAAQEDEDDGGGFLERLIEDNLSSAGREVEIRGFRGALSSRASLELLTISDDEGVWLTLRDAVLDWNRGALLRGALEVQELSAAEVIVERRPAAQPGADLPPAEAQGFSLPDLPVSVDVDLLNLERVVLGQPILGEEAAVSVSGAAELAGGEGEAQLAVERVDGQQGALTLEGAYSNDTQVLALDLALDEGPDGIAAKLLDLPGRPSVALSVEGTGPLSDYAAEIALATGGEPRLDGTVSLQTEGEGDAQVRQFSAELGGDLAPVFSPEFRPFFGDDIGLVAEGSIFADGRIEIPRIRIDAQSLNLAGEVVIGADRLPQRIDVEGEIASPEGGPVLLPVGSDLRVQRAGLDVSFDASEGEDWTGEIVLDGLETPAGDFGQLALTGTGRIATEDDQQVVTADFDFAAEGVTLEQGDAQAALGESVTGDAALRWRSGEAIVLDSLTLQGESYRLAGEATIDPTGEGITASAEAALSAQDLSAFSGLAGRPLDGSAELALDLEAGLLAGTFDVALEGTTTDLEIGQPQLDGLLGGDARLGLNATRDETGTRVEALELIAEGVQVSGSADLSSEAGSVDLDVRIPDASRVDPRIEGPAVLDVTAQLQDGAWQFDLEAEGAQAAVSAEGRVTELDAPAPLVRAEAAVTAQDLSLFSEIAGRPLSGAVSLTAQGSARTDLSDYDVTFDGASQSLEVGVDIANRLLAGGTELSGSVEREGAGVRVNSLSVENPQLTLSGQGLYAPGVSTGSAEFRLAETGLVVQGLSGPVAGDAQVEEVEEGWRVAFDAEGLGADVNGLMDITGLETEAPRVEGEVAVEADDLSRFSALANRELSGAVDLQAEGFVTADLQNLDVVLNGTTSDIGVGQPEADRLLEGTTEIAIAAARSGERIEVDRFRVSNPQITASGEGTYAPGAGRIVADIDVPQTGAILPQLDGPAEIDLRAQEEDGTWQVVLDASGPDVALQADVDVSDIPSGAPLIAGQASLRADELSRFSQLANRLLSGAIQAEIAGQARTSLDTYDVSVDVNATGLSIGQADVDRLLGATTTIDLAVRKDSAGAPIQVEEFALDTPALTAAAEGLYGAESTSLDVSARLADIAPYAPGFTGPVTLSGNVSEAPGAAVALDLDLGGPGGTTLAVDGTVNPQTQRLNLDVQGGAPLGLANRVIEPRSIDGRLTFDLSVEGPPALSSVSGTVATDGARAVLPELDAVLNDIDATVRLSNGSATLNVTAQKQSGGTLSAAGQVALSGAFPADLAIELSSLDVRQPGLYTTSVSGTVNVDGPLTGGALISGTLRLGETELRIPSGGLGVSGPDFDIQHVNTPPAVRQTLQRAGLLDKNGRSTANGAGGGGGRAFRLDLNVVAENRIFIRGRGLDAELGGSLRLSGTTNNVIPSGQFELIRGRLDILGQRFVLDEGRVTLEGDFTPFVRLVASTEAEDVDVFIVLEGPVNSPDIDFRSQPELPQDEVLARLLFGRSITDISPLQAAQLASAVATLSGRGGDGLVSQIRNEFGLDDLDVTTDEEGNAALRAGAYISENIYTDVTVDAEGEAEINLNLDITPEVTVKGGAANSGETSLGIFYERDY